MNNDFALRIKNIEKELLQLKTSSEYTSIRNTIKTSSGNVTTGLYVINYKTNGENIISDVYLGNRTAWGTIFARTPDATSQVVEVNSTETVIQQGTAIPVAHNTSFVVVSNVPVISIERIN